MCLCVCVCVCVCARARAWKEGLARLDLKLKLVLKGSWKNVYFLSSLRVVHTIVDRKAWWGEGTG